MPFIKGVGLGNPSQLVSGSLARILMRVSPVDCGAAAATAASGSLSSAGPTAYNGVNKIIAATLLFRASSSFDNILISEGQDVSNLLKGLGSEGLSKLFHNLNSLAWGVVASQVRALSVLWRFGRWIC